jgi:hypothetical protein
MDGHSASGSWAWVEDIHKKSRNRTNLNRNPISPAQSGKPTGYVSSARRLKSSDVLHAPRGWTANWIAFNKVCDRLGLQCHREDPVTELMVDAIIEIAATGERDPDQLCEGVLLP